MSGELQGFWYLIDAAFEKQNLSFNDVRDNGTITSLNSAQLAQGLNALRAEYVGRRQQLNSEENVNQESGLGSSLWDAWTDETFRDNINIIDRFLMYMRKQWPQRAAKRFIESTTDMPRYDPSTPEGLKGWNPYEELEKLTTADAANPKNTGGEISPTREYESTLFDHIEWPQGLVESTIGRVTKDFDYKRMGKASMTWVENLRLAWKSGTFFGNNYGLPLTTPKTWVGRTDWTLVSTAEATTLVELICYKMYLQRAANATDSGGNLIDAVIDQSVEVATSTSRRNEIEALLEKQASEEGLDVFEAARLKELQGALKEGELGSAEIESEDPGKLAERMRHTEQTLLMRNLQSFAQQYTALLKVRKEKYKKTYLMQGNPSEMVNRLTLKPFMGDFLNFRTDQISQLAPKFKIYQIVYNNNNEFEREVEFKFANRSNIPPMEETTNILESRGREAVGVKSFNWEYIGTNPITARNDIKAELKLFFQSFDDLFEKRTGVDDNGTVFPYRYVDLILRNPEVDGKQIISKEEETSDPDEQHPDKFETKIIVGWNFRGTKLEDKVKAANKNISDLSYFNEVLFMTLIDHQFDIEEDGTLGLTITYRARLDAMLQDKKSDILSTPEIFNKRMGWEKEIKKLKKKCESSDDVKEELKQLKEEYEKRKMKYRAESYQSLLNELMGVSPARPNQSRVYLISVDMAKFISAGEDLSKLDDFLIPPDGALSISTTAIKESISSKVNASGPKTPGFSDAVKNAAGASQDVAKNAARTVGIDDINPKTAATAAALNPGTTVLAAGATASALGPQATGAAISSLINDYQTTSMVSTFQTTGELSEEDINKYLMTTIPPSKPGEYNIHYFFFGDLIEMLAGRALTAFVVGDDSAQALKDRTYSQSKLDKIKVLLGSMEWQTVGSNNKHAVFRCNLGALPVSLQKYKNFMLRRVVAKKRDLYTLLDFIRDFLKYLLDDILGGNSEDSDESLKLDIEVKSCVLSMPGKGGNIDPVLDKIMEGQPAQINKSPASTTDKSSAPINWPGPVLDLDTITEYNTVVPYGDPESNSFREAYHYLTIYVTNKNPTHLRGDEEKDKTAGIHHFHIGENMGIFKRATFNRTDAKYLREARFTQKSYDPLRTLSSVYDIEIEMFGNTIFYPGQYLFINPFGLGSSLGFPYEENSLSNIMGLGGYHLVTGVDSSMDEDGFTTNITARYEASGDGKKYAAKAKETTQSDCEATEATEIK